MDDHQKDKLRVSSFGLMSLFTSLKRLSVRPTHSGAALRYLFASSSLLLILFSILAISPLDSQAAPGYKSQKINADVIYIGPGDSTYSLFGHVAIRIKSRDKDLIYDLGITQSLGTKGLSNIAMGRALFHGEVRSFPKMLKSWQRRDRDVTSYPLQLDQLSIKRLWRELESRVSQPVSAYLYDPLRENCATQLRQALDTVTGGLITRSIRQRTPTNTSFRDDTRDGYARALGVLTMIELLVGPSLDRQRGVWALSYRPQTLMRELRRIRLVDRALLGPKKLFYVRHGAPTTGGQGASWIPISLSCYLVITLGALGRRKYKMKSDPNNIHNQKMRWIWSIYYMSAILSLLFTTLALLLTIKSSWLEVRNSWLLVFGSPLDLLLLTLRPRSSIAHISRILSYLHCRGIVTLCFTALLCLITGLVPPLPVLLFTLMTWGACLLSTRVIHSCSPHELSVEATSEFPEEPDSSERSWMEL